VHARGARFDKRPARVVGRRFDRHANFGRDPSLPEPSGGHERVTPVVAGPRGDPDGVLRAERTVMSRMLDEILRRGGPRTRHERVLGQERRALDFERAQLRDGE
jgi:hypothetical protein